MLKKHFGKKLKCNLPPSMKQCNHIKVFDPHEEEKRKEKDEKGEMMNQISVVRLMITF